MEEFGTIQPARGSERLMGGRERERETKTHRLLSRVPNGDRRGPQSRETPVQHNVPEQRTGSELFMLLYWNVAHKALKP